MPHFSAQCLKKKNSIALRIIDDTPAKSNVDSLSQHESQHSEQAELAEAVQTQHESQHSEQVELAEAVQTQHESQDSEQVELADDVRQTAQDEQDVSLASETKKPRKQKRNTES